MAGEVHDVWHCQAPKLSFHHKTALSQTIFSFTRKNLLPTQFCFIASLELLYRSLTRLYSVVCGMLKILDAL